MYSQYFGLARKPFELTPDPANVFMSDSHKEALAILRYGVIERKGFLLLTGGVGTGKTTLLHVLIKLLGPKVHLCFITNPTLSPADFYYFLALRYGIKNPEGSKARFLNDFAGILKRCRERKERLLLIIDEAQVLPVKLLEEIRLLSNLDYETYGVLSIFLAGQPELTARLAHKRLLPLRQRIAIRFGLKPFSYGETVDYIAYRLRKAGATRRGLFAEDATLLIHRVSQGVPRVINVLCDHAMLTAFSKTRPGIDVETVLECVQDLHLPGAESLAVSQFGKRKLRLKQFFPAWLAKA